MWRAERQRGQAALELIAAIPVLLAVGALLIQLLAIGHAQSLADGAAEAGAIAVAAGLPAEPAVRSALPGWAGRRVDIEVDRGEVEVRLRPPSILPRAGDSIGITSRAWVREAASR